jgi:hypothetical protein
MYWGDGVMTGQNGADSPPENTVTKDPIVTEIRQGPSNDSNGLDRRGLAALGRAALPAADGPQQAALAWDAAGAPVVTVESVAPKRNWRRGREMRADARRTAEYLAERGPTPVEAIHDVAKLRWKVAIREISRHAKCSELEAMKMWLACANALLPYSAARLDTIELGANAAGGLALAHWLAANAMGDRLATGAVANMGPVFDSENNAGIQSRQGGVPSAAPLLELPPIAPD